MRAGDWVDWGGLAGKVKSGEKRIRSISAGFSFKVPSVRYRERYLPLPITQPFGVS